MNLQELKNKYPLLISYMENHNNSRQYIRHIKNESLWILRESENYHWKTYYDVYQTCVEKYTNKHTLNYKRNMLLVFKLFVLESVVPDGSIHAHQIRHAKASHWLEDGMNIVQISFLLGHANLETTMTYLDITTEQESKVLATLGDENKQHIPKKWKTDFDSFAAFLGLNEIAKR